MSAAPTLGIPPLAGLCSYEEAARIGHGVEESVHRLLRFQWVELRLGRIALSRIPATPEWEVKGAFALHQWLDAEHADALRERIGELRNPAPRVDAPPSAALNAFLDAVDDSADTIELLTGLYAVARAALVEAYRAHLDTTNPLVDHPTRRILRHALTDGEEQLAWGREALDALVARSTDGARRSDAFGSGLRALLDEAGGIGGGAGTDPAGIDARVEAGAAAPAGGRHAMTPRRDARFHGQLDFDFPPHVVCDLDYVPADERNLALLCKRLLEMDVPEMMASFLTEDALPWPHERRYRRQLWDEARHSMMGEAAFEAKGIDWTRIPLNVGFALRLNLHADARERELMLYAIEQSLMPADTGKRREFETAVAAGDALSAHFHDFDWADEVLHARIGRAWLREAGMHGRDVLERGRRVHDRTWAALAEHGSFASRRTWWNDFVREVLGRDSAARAEDLVDPAVIAE